MRTWVLMMCFMVCACTPRDPEPDMATERDLGQDTDPPQDVEEMTSGDVSPDTETDVSADTDTPSDMPDLGPTTPDFAPVARTLEEGVSGGLLQGYDFVLMGPDASPWLAASGGDMRTGDVIPYDSGIKQVSSLVILTLVRDGMLSLEDTMAERLGWTGDAGQVTVRSLLSFTSGLPGDADCISLPPILRPNGRLFLAPSRATLADCTRQIYEGGLMSDPGTMYWYGGTHQTVLAHVAEVVTGQTWDALVEARVKAPLGLSQEFRYATNRIAGGAVGTALDLAKVYQAFAMDAGWIESPPGREPMLPSSLAQAMLEDALAGDVMIGDSPFENLGVDAGFGLGIWLACPYAEVRADCADPVGFGSGGHGTFVWMDRRGRYVAALAIYEEGFSSFGEGYEMYTRLRPVIMGTLGR